METQGPTNENLIDTNVENFDMSSVRSVLSQKQISMLEKGGNIYKEKVSDPEIRKLLWFTAVMSLRAINDANFDGETNA